jgi:PHD/YefM family antitoxin component YafN of YafNO toxin-antitoxin module
MGEDYPNLSKALRETWEAEQDMEKLRLMRRCQELYGRIRELQHQLEQQQRREAA